MVGQKGFSGDFRGQKSFVRPLSGRQNNAKYYFIKGLSWSDPEIQEGGFRIPFKLHAQRYEDGLVYHADGMKVFARHNMHLGDSPAGKSFSFRIEMGAKSVVYSGDGMVVQL